MRNATLPTRDSGAFRAPSWARNPHVQTVGGHLLRPRVRTRLERERWATPDGDVLDLDFPRPASGDDRPLVVVLHGLEGHARRRYALLLYRELDARGLQAVGLNFRGCSGEPNRTARAYHSGETHDLRLVVERLRERHPSRPLGAIGFSLGGNVLLKHLGERARAGEAALVSAAVAVSVPYDLSAGADRLESTVAGRAYGRWLLRSLIRKVRRKRRLLEGRVDVQGACRSRTIRQFDERVTAPLYGFRSAESYYGESSSGPYVAEIRVPTLLLHALDDPFLPAAAIPVDGARSNPWVTLELSEHGGHVGFMGGTPWSPHFHAERRAAAFLAATLAGSPFEDPDRGA